MRGWRVWLGLWMLLASAPVQAEVCSDSPVVGTPCSFFANSYLTSTPVSVNVDATCRLVSDSLYLFVEDSLWSAGLVTSDQLDDLKAAFETSTPRQSGGFGPLLQSVLGNPPDVFDYNTHLYVVIHDIAQSAAQPVNAYFRPEDVSRNQYNEAGPTSNKHEIIFLQGDANLTADAHLAEWARVYGSLIAYGADSDEDAWVNDSVSRGSVLWLGYSVYGDDIAAFSVSPTYSLLGDNHSVSTILYPGATSLFGLYLIETIAPSFLQAWIAQSENGILGFDQALTANGHGEKNFCDYFHAWSIRNALERGDYKYRSLTLTPFSSTVISSHPGHLTGSLPSYGSHYLRVEAKNAVGSTLEVNYTLGDTTGIRLSLARLSSTDSTLADVQELEFYANRTNTYRFDDLSVYDQYLFIGTRCAEGASLTFDITTRLALPEDGDVESEAESEADSESETPDGDTDGETSVADGDQEVVIVGDKSCHEIYDCAAACSNTVCQDACVADGTLDAQSQWKSFLVCLNGYNPSSDNCLSADKSAFDRDKCAHVNCSGELETCSATTQPQEKSSGGGCQGGLGAAWWFVALLAAGGLRRRARA